MHAGTRSQALIQLFVAYTSVCLLQEMDESLGMRLKKAWELG